MREGRIPSVVPISKAEATFLLRALAEDPERVGRFRIMPKIHKSPIKFCPIVSTVGTFTNEWSRWLDYWFQQLTPLVDSYLKDTQSLLDLL